MISKLKMMCQNRSKTVSGMSGGGHAEKKGTSSYWEGGKKEKPKDEDKEEGEREKWTRH